LHKNINAAEGLHDVLKTNLSPKGTVRMYMDSRLGKEREKGKSVFKIIIIMMMMIKGSYKIIHDFGLV
jgi:hypothetical protein